MKTIAVEISIEHCPDESEGEREVKEALNAAGYPGTQVAGARCEGFRLAIIQEIDDSRPVAEHIEQCAAELLRRYRSLNARKTN